MVYFVLIASFKVILCSKNSMYSFSAVVILLLSVTVSALPTATTKELAVPVAVQALPTTETGLSAPCKPITLIFARGSMLQILQDYPAELCIECLN